MMINNTIGVESINLSELLITWVPIAFSIVGSIIIIYGGIVAAIKTLIAELRRKDDNYAEIRFKFTSKIALALEFL